MTTAHPPPSAARCRATPPAHDRCVPRSSSTASASAPPAPDNAIAQRAHAALARTARALARTRRSMPPRTACRAAGRPDGQLRSRPPEHRRGPRRLPGLHAHRPRDRDRRVRGQPGARRRDRDSARRDRRACTCSGLLSPGGVHSHERQIARHGRAGRARRRRATSACTRSSTAATRRRAAPAASLARSWTTTCAEASGRAHRVDRRALLRDGSRPALGPRRRGVRAASSTARRRTRAKRARLRWTRPTRAARTTSSSRPRRSSTAPARVRDARRRRRRLHELPRRSRARDDARADRVPPSTGFVRAARAARLAPTSASRSYGDEFAHLPVAFAPQSIRNSFGEYVAGLGLTQLRIAETEKYAHVTYFFNGGVEAVVSGRGPHPGAVARRSRPTTCSPR